MSTDEKALAFISGIGFLIGFFVSDICGKPIHFSVDAGVLAAILFFVIGIFTAV